MPRQFSFAAPERLWVLVGLLVLGVLGVMWARHRRDATEAYAEPAMRASAAPLQPGWRRPAAAAGLALATVALAAGFARPQVLDDQAVERAIVVVALDTSLSMLADDVSPDRFTAAQRAAQGFIRDLPAQIDVGLVAYDAAARLVAAPTVDHESVAVAVDSLTLAGGTSQGDALTVSLRAALQGLEPRDDRPPPARVVLLSDGGSTSGSPVADAVAAARQAQVPVSTIAYGTPDGVAVVNGTAYRVPVDTAALAAISGPTGGQTYEAATAEQLRQVYRDIGSQLVTQTARTDVADAFAGAGLVLLVATAVGSLASSSRLLS